MTVVRDTAAAWESDLCVSLSLPVSALYSLHVCGDQEGVLYDLSRCEWALGSDCSVSSASTEWAG